MPELHDMIMIGAGQIAPALLCGIACVEGTPLIFAASIGGSLDIIEGGKLAFTNTLFHFPSFLGILSGTVSRRGGM